MSHYLHLILYSLCRNNQIEWFYNIFSNILHIFFPKANFFSNDIKQITLNIIHCRTYTLISICKLFLCCNEIEMKTHSEICNFYLPCFIHELSEKYWNIDYVLYIIGTTVSVVYLIQWQRLSWLNLCIGFVKWAGRHCRFAHLLNIKYFYLRSRKWAYTWVYQSIW